MIPEWSDLSRYGEPGVVVDLDAIGQAITNLLTITPGEMLFNPQLGCDLESLLFELIDNETAQMIKTKLIDCISRWDPRIRVLPRFTTVIPDPENNTYHVTLGLEIYTRSDPVFFQFNLNRLE